MAAVDLNEQVSWENQKALPDLVVYFLLKIVENSVFERRKDVTRELLICVCFIFNDAFDALMHKC